MGLTEPMSLLWKMGWRTRQDSNLQPLPPEGYSATYVLSSEMNVVMLFKL